MADLTITPANIKPVTGARLLTVTLGEGANIGDSVYKRQSDASNKYFKSSADSPEESQVTGIMVANGNADGMGVIVVTGRLKMGAILQKGMLYVASPNKGKIMPFTDLVDLDIVSVIGFAEDTETLVISLLPTFTEFDAP